MRVFNGLLFFVALAICIGLFVRTELVSRPQTVSPPQGTAGAARLEFDVATIKPSAPLTVGGTRIGGQCHGVDSQVAPSPRSSPPPLGQCLLLRLPLSGMIMMAYELSPGIDKTVTGGPDWVNSAPFDIQAEAEDPSIATQAQLLSMLQRLIADRFKLRLHTEPREVQGFALVVAKNGPKLKPATGDYSGSRGDLLSISATNAPVAELANMISRRVGGPVIDHTGLTGGYEFSLSWERADSDAMTASIITAIQEQLGLRLESQKVKIDTIVIDSAEKPAEN
jgi:uncharacterized protein (TIGR03435 family)